MGNSKIEHFCWLDLEMTGLDVNKDKILEIAILVTDKYFNEKGRFHNYVFQPDEVLKEMNPWCKKQHKASGLLEKVRQGIALTTLEEEIPIFLNSFFQPEDSIVLCGNSIGQDRKFVEKYLSKFSSRLHYRMLDVSSFKILFEERYAIKFKKANSHLAMDDILESIEELKYYMKSICPSE